MTCCYKSLKLSENKSKTVRKYDQIQCKTSPKIFLKKPEMSFWLSMLVSCQWLYTKTLAFGTYGKVVVHTPKTALAPLFELKTKKVWLLTFPEGRLNTSQKHNKQKVVKTLSNTYSTNFLIAQSP